MNVCVLVRGNKSGDLYDEYKTLDIPMVFMPLGYYNLGKWILFYKFVKKNAFNTICDFNANFAGIPIWLATLARIENRITFYRQGKDHFKPDKIRQVYNRLMNRLVHKYSTKILANSIAGIEYFFPYRESDDSRFKVIYNGIDFKQFQMNENRQRIRQDLKIPENAFVIGHSGRHDKSKNHATILKVAGELIHSDPNIYLVLCGYGTEELADEVIRIGIFKNIRLLGYRRDVVDVMQIFDVFYFPSITEGQPNALLEAMATGLPIIASNIDSIKEIMPVDSKLFDPFDTKNIVKEIRKMICDPKKEPHKELIEYSAKRFNAFDRFNDFYNELIY